MLEIEIESLWLSDGRGRLVKSRGSNVQKAPHLVIAASKDGQIVALGSEVPDALAVELQAAVAGGPPPRDPAAAPASIARCQELLERSLGPVDLAAGPSYVIPATTAFDSAAKIHLTGDKNAGLLRDQNPERGGWSAEEWQLLIDGHLGPWAMATVDGQIIAICHSARLAERGAEAGVWTDPDFRGQGHAAAVTAAWAALLAPSGRHLFYSTSAENVSSQRVAARLELRLIGWMWQLSERRRA